MADITICDLCNDKEPLHPKTGRYMITVTKFAKQDGDSHTTQDTEFDLCGRCMEVLRKAGLK